MSAYNGSGSNSLVPNTVPPTVLFPGDDKYLWGTSVAAGSSPTPGQIQTPNDTNVVAETPVAAAASIAIALAPRPGGGAPPAMLITMTSTANPGSPEIDIQEAGIDADGAYQLVGTANKITSFTLQGAIYVAMLEINPAIGRFYRLKNVSNPNSVAYTAKVQYE